jgi:hypothetical protein
MTIQQFHILNEIEKVELIMLNGRLLSQSLEEDCRIFLYQLDNFYVATRYSMNDDLLKEIRCFSEITQAIPYLRKIQGSIHPASRVYAVPER